MNPLLGNEAREAFYRAVQKAVDDEAAGMPKSGGSAPGQADPKQAK